MLQKSSTFALRLGSSSMVQIKGLEPLRANSLAPQASVSTNSTISAYWRSENYSPPSGSLPRSFSMRFYKIGSPDPWLGRWYRWEESNLQNTVSKTALYACSSTPIYSRGCWFCGNNLNPLKGRKTMKKYLIVGGSWWDWTIDIVINSHAFCRWTKEPYYGWDLFEPHTDAHCPAYKEGMWRFNTYYFSRTLSDFHGGFAAFRTTLTPY